MFAGHREEVRIERGELYPAVKVIDETRTNAKRFQANRICERFQNTVFNEFYRVVFRNKIDKPLDELQTDLEGWLRLYNEERPYEKKWAMRKLRCKRFSTASQWQENR